MASSRSKDSAKSGERSAAAAVLGGGGGEDGPGWAEPGGEAVANMEGVVETGGELRMEVGSVVVEICGAAIEGLISDGAVSNWSTMSVYQSLGQHAYFWIFGQERTAIATWRFATATKSSQRTEVIGRGYII